MSYTVSLQQRIQQLKKTEADLPEILYQVQKDATLRAVEAAAEATPPKAGSLKGTNTRSGALKQHWAADSQTEPQKTGNGYETILANNMDYASYVNDGHRMDRHFVPGLYVNPHSGLLEYDPSAKVGMMVGTKTKYVKGEFMVDKAKEVYEKTVLAELDKKIREVLE